MAQAKLFFVGIKGLIENDKGQILLLQADVTAHRGVDKPYWDIPGGRIDEDENDVIGVLKREIREETGIIETGNIEFFTAVISNHQIPLEAAKKAGLVLMVYKVAVPNTSKVKISHEHVAYEWINRKEAKKRLMHKYPKEFTDQL